MQEITKFKFFNNISLHKKDFKKDFEDISSSEYVKTVIDEPGRKVKILPYKLSENSIFILEETNKKKTLYYDDYYKEGHEKDWYEKIRALVVFSIKDPKLSNDDIELFKKQISVLKDDNITSLSVEYLLNKDTFDVTMDLSIIYDYLAFIKNKNIIDEMNFNNRLKPIKDMEISSYKYFKENFDDWIPRINSMREVCSKNGYSTYNNSFDKYDDINIWSDNDFLYIRSQNTTLCISDLKKENHSILIYYNDYESSEELKNNIKNIDIKSNGVLSVENGEITSCNLSCFEHTAFRILCSSNLLLDKRDIHFPVDIYSYDYQRKYFECLFKSNESDFLIEMFLSSADYDSNEGILYRDDILYMPKVNNFEISNECVLNDFDYCNIDKINKITYLNEDWMKGLKKLSNVLKNTNLLPKSYLSMIKEENKNLSYLISVVDDKIEELEGYKLKRS